MVFLFAQFAPVRAIAGLISESSWRRAGEGRKGELVGNLPPCVGRRPRPVTDDPEMTVAKQPFAACGKLTGMTPWRSFSLVIIWLTRIGGAVITVCGISFLVLAWAERSIAPVVMGVITVGIGLVIISIRGTPNGNIEYGLFRSEKPRVAQPHR